jgi:hypothetical protein
MPPLIERDEFPSFVSASAFGYSGAFFWCGKIGEVADEFRGRHILLFFGKFPHFFDCLLQQLAHAEQCSIPPNSLHGVIAGLSMGAAERDGSLVVRIGSAW